MRDKIAKIMGNAWRNFTKYELADLILALPELAAVIEKANKWDEAMAQPHYCDDCKAALLDQRILELECELVKYREDAEKWNSYSSVLKLIYDIYKQENTLKTPIELVCEWKTKAMAFDEKEKAFDAEWKMMKEEQRLYQEAAREAKETIDKLTEGLKVKKKCVNCNRIGQVHDTNCFDCKGKGIVFRPLTDDEKIEALEYLIKRGWHTIHRRVIYNEKEPYEKYKQEVFVVLKSGARVVRG